MTPLSPEATQIAATSIVEPLGDPTPERPDRDWQSLRDESMSELREGSWTDHNVSDPGVTMLEAAMLSIADGHARTALARFDEAAITSAMWRDHPHASEIDIPVGADLVTELASGLHDHHETVLALVASAQDRPDAVAALTSDPNLTWSPALARAAVRVVRQSAFARAALDLAGAIDAAVDAVGVDQAPSLLRLDPGFEDLWDAELLDLLELRRRRRLANRVAQLRTAIAQASTRADVAALLNTSDTDPSDRASDAAIDAAAALIPRPEVPPEQFESNVGDTLAWPPTAIQSRSVEPVIGADYVRLALGVTGVRRAWVRKGHRHGLGWNGNSIEGSVDHPGALTILVEAEDDVATGNLDLEHSVLRALGDPTDDPAAGELAEVDHPYALYRDDPTRVTPRRMICDELAATRLSICEIEVRGAIHVAVGTIDDRAALIDAALDRVRDLLLNGRPESQTPTDSTGPDGEIDGPWPVPPAAPSGWIPGEAIRFNEVIERLADDPDILGVSDVALREIGDSWYQPGPDDIAELSVPSFCVPRLSEQHCVTVAFVLEEDA